MKRLLMITLLLAVMPVFGQMNGPPVNVVKYNVDSPTIFLDYDGSGNNIYVCEAKAVSPTASSAQSGYVFSLSVSATTLTSVVVSANVGTVTTASAHGLRVAQQVVISGSTTAALNGTYYVQTVATSTTFTITTAGVGNATYNNAALTLSGNVPLLTGAIWAITKLNYNGSNQLTDVQHAGGTAGAHTYICSNRAVTTGATAIYYK